jgi:hypothetical protein
MPDYQQLSRDEVLRLVLEKDQLTDEATALRERQKEIERATPRQTYKEFRGVRTIATMQDFESRSAIPHCGS